MTSLEVELMETGGYAHPFLVNVNSHDFSRSRTNGNDRFSSSTQVSPTHDFSRSRTNGNLNVVANFNTIGWSS